MKITKSRLKTIILEEMQRMDEFQFPWKKPKGELPGTVPVGADLDDESGREDWWNAPSSDPSTGGHMGLEYDPKDYGTDVGSFGQPTQAQLDAHDYAARSGGTAGTAGQMLASMDLSGIPEAGEGGGWVGTPGVESATYHGTSTDVPSAFQGLPVGATPEQIAWKAANPAGTVMEPMRVTASPPAAADPAKYEKFVGYGDYVYQPLADGSFMWSKGGKTGLIPAGSQTAAQVVSDRAEMGARSRMAESRDALKNIIRMELKKSGII